MPYMIRNERDEIVKCLKKLSIWIGCAGSRKLSARLNYWVGNEQT